MGQLYKDDANHVSLVFNLARHREFARGQRTKYSLVNRRAKRVTGRGAPECCLLHGAPPLSLSPTKDWGLAPRL
jgi:hypothetical protein